MSSRVNGLEQVRAIERHIAQLLNDGESAEIDKSTIENGYSVLDATQGEVPSDLHEKCGAIVGELQDRFSIKAEYSIKNGSVRFCQVRNA